MLLLVPGPFAFVLGAGLLAAFTAAIAIAVRRGRTAPCWCFGVSSTPLGRSHVARNLFLIAVAVLGLAAAAAGGSAVTAAAALAAGCGVVAGLLVTRLDDLMSLVRTS